MQEHNDQSLPWEEAELEAAREIFKEFLDIITSQLLLKEENSSLRKFAHMAAHDIQGSLRGISYALTWMEEDGFSKETTRDHQEIALTQAKKLQHLTTSLLEMSLLQEHKPQFREANLSEIAQEARTLLQHDLDQCGGQIDIAPLPEQRVVPELIIRLFLNLFSNAIKYAQSDAPLRINVDFHSQTDGPLQLIVTDNGCGIPPQHAQKIFEASARLQAEGEGSGFGLAICSEIASIHDGRIYLDPSYTRGARFVFEWPEHAHD